ncbi:DUF4230 domain-containing protein [Paraclostridium bifermentans]|uniref:DUF4230 domain-containing protein n=1 Tax=Paraclostridium bifermentans TaxID=1490 RepID=UPI00359C4198
MLQKYKKNNKNKIIVLFIMFGIISGIIISSGMIFSEKPPKDTSKVLNTIEEVVEISTSKYNYSNITTITKDKSFKNIKIPFTEKSFIIKYNGIIKGGVNAKDISISNNTRNSITVDISKCSIIDHYIDENNIYVYDIKNALFNKVQVNEVIEELANSKKEYEEKVIKEGFMKEIQEGIKVSLEKSLKDLGYENVLINFSQ